MQKITEIKEFYTVKRKEKINGIETEVEKKMSRYKEVKYVEGWARFGHFLLDRVFFFAFVFLFYFGLGVLFAITGNADLIESLGIERYEAIYNWLLLQPFFYFLFEFSMQSSPGKAILKRIVVDEYGNKPSTKQIFIRSISRAVPFDALSCLGGTGWHDNWSNTFVIRKKDLAELKLVQQINSVDLKPTPPIY